MAKEAKARIKLNKLLEQAGWHFFDDANGKANIQLETNVKLTQKLITASQKSDNRRRTSRCASWG
ncbi:MAG: hypothetical protein HZC40_17715 [Chloroflexi bacterium]|nr:hypothetical protein [Chloroflexota bacterium]